MDTMSIAFIDSSQIRPASSRSARESAGDGGCANHPPRVMAITRETIAGNSARAIAYVLFNARPWKRPMPVIKHNPKELFPQYRCYSHATEIHGDSRLLI